ncbi:MAG: Fe-S cluster assembly ATPase SufC [Bacteroidia bacterium]|nr:MAG: Fe-S cluster assembly ATPase SufC [Bacteroidia bacterium]
MLSIKNLTVSIHGKQIIGGLNLEVKEGEVHAIMGPNGSGKSTLASVIAGRDMFDVDAGEITYMDQNIFDMAPETRAREGIFLGFQYPVEIPGVSIANFLRTAINEKRKYLGLEPMTGAEFLKMMEEKKKMVEIHSKLTNRSVNEGFSGGEKKKNEIFQMAMLEPRLAILDETDSGLDIDALKVVANGVNKLRRPDNATIIITHYQRLLDYIVPDFVHVLYDGRIIKSGDKKLALELESKGYDWVKKETKADTIP